MVTAQTDLGKLLLLKKISCLFILFMRRISNNRTYLILWKINTKISQLSDQSEPTIIFNKLQLCLISSLSRYSYRNREIELLLTLTDSFTWEELPNRDPENGNITNAGYIPVVQSHTKNTVSFALAFHSIQSAVPIVMSHDMIYSM